MNGCDNTEEQTRALAAFGLKPDAPLPIGSLDLWPEHIPALRLFSAAQTQWNVGPSGAVGLRYEALPLLREMLCICQDDWPQTLQDVRVLEQETLRIWREKR